MDSTPGTASSTTPLGPPRSRLAPPPGNAQSNIFPSPNSAQRVSGSVTTASRIRRNKVALKPGHSALDWANLRSSGKNLRGIDYPGLLKVSKEELVKHCKDDDAWTVLGGKVYNITPYISFHPGGERDVLRCAGKDGTKLFQSTHAWVNYEHMLDKCLIGFYVG